MMAAERIDSVAVVKEVPEGAIVGDVSHTSVLDLARSVASRRERRAAGGAEGGVAVDAVVTEEAATFVERNATYARRRASRGTIEPGAGDAASCGDDAEPVVLTKFEVEQMLAASFLALTRPVGEFIQARIDEGYAPTAMIDASAKLIDAVELLWRRNLDRVYVINGTGTLVGVLRAVDVFRLVLQVQSTREPAG